MQEEQVLDRTEEIVQPQEQNTQSQTQEAVQTPSDAQEKNWRQMRQAKEQAERERDELLQRMQEIENQHKKQEPEEEDDSLAPDDLVEWRHVEKKLKKLQGEIQKFQQASTLTNAESRLKNQFSDFDKVVTKENVELLKQTEPEMAASLMANSDLYSKGVSAYKLIKNLGLYKEDNFSEDRQRAQANALKPRSTSTVGVQSGDTPLSQANAFANGLTPELKAQLLKEMNQARKNQSR